MRRKGKKHLTVGFVSLGCPKNTVDSERMLAEIAEAGLIITAEADNADVVVINTCGFIAPARDESIDVITHALACKKRGTVKKVIVAGCLAERSGEELFSQIDGIDAVIGLDKRDSIVRIIEQTFGQDRRLAYLNKDLSQQRDKAAPDDRTRLLITPGHCPYLRISEGCNHRCSFCTIPSIRGPFRSKPQQLVLAEAKELVTAGAVELNLIGQDTAFYGRDLKDKHTLSSLLKEIEKIESLRWIRLMYLYPAGITDDIIETVARRDKIVNYFDIPIQHISDRVLKAMRRSDTKEQITRLIENLRAAIPDVTLRTTLITGFPGETEEEFNELVAFVNMVKFDALGCFTYCAEPGTPAAELHGQIPEQVKQRRAEEIMLAQQQIAFAKNEERIGSSLECLVDFADSSTVTGRHFGQAPEIDSLCFIENCSANPGQFVQTKVIESRDYDLVVRQI
ncbi:MAG: 30S ribosomal protein S12 methylthiotransferase RimO [Sedimentisphaerales bacterium]|nr:30S ribosomal protein S12 methylthiotransferase RimO [Sedimentisphaerales bacterium]